MDEEDLDETVGLDENNNALASLAGVGRVGSRQPTAAANMLKSATFGFDLIVCGNCQADFRLANLNEFIEHKIAKCCALNARNRAGRLLNKRQQQNQSKFLLAGLAAAASGWSENNDDNDDQDEGSFRFFFFIFILFFSSISVST